MLLGSQLEAQSQSGVRQETIRIQGPIKGLKLALRHVVSSSGAPGNRRIVLILHGAGVPVSGNPNYPFGGRSWMQALAEEGLDVWGVDFYGFGESDRYPEMSEPADRHPPLGTVDQTAEQVGAAVTYLKQRYGVEQIMLLGDSQGTLPAGLFAGRHPELVSRLVLFGPVTPFTSGPAPGAKLAAHQDLEPKDLWALFTGWSRAAGEPAVLDSTMAQGWIATYLRSDPTSGTRTPASVRIPNGWQADLAQVAAGRFPFDPSRIRAPTLIVMGEWDEIAYFPGAQWLLQSLRQAPQRRLAVIGRGSHTIQFEAERGQLYRVMADFLKE
jgi:pimeloyl-ACP methyl ester carboxylesterase